MIISLMLILLIPGKMAKGHKSGSGLIQWSREAIKILSILVFKLIRNNVIRKDTKTAVSFTLGGCFTYSQCLCWELCTFFLFNKSYSLATVKKKNCPTKFQKQRNLFIYLMRQEITQNNIRNTNCSSVLLMKMNANMLNPILKNQFNNKYLKSL